MVQVDDRNRFIEHIYSITNPIKPHEAEVISSVLGHKFGQHAWRFRKNHFCEGCSREMSALDYFFSALRQHSVAFINRQVMGNPEEGVIDYIGNQFEVRIDQIKVEIAYHALDIMCLNCGTVNYGIDPELEQAGGGSGGGYVRYFYVHPGCGGSNTPKCMNVTQIVRIGEASYDKLIHQLGISDFARDTSPG